MKHSLVFSFLFVCFGSLSTITYAAEEPELKRSAPITIPIAQAGRRADWESVSKQIQDLVRPSASTKQSNQRLSPQEMFIIRDLIEIESDYRKRISLPD